MSCQRYHKQTDKVDALNCLPHTNLEELVGRQLLTVLPPRDGRARVALGHTDEENLVTQLVRRLEVRGLHDVSFLEKEDEA